MTDLSNPVTRVPVVLDTRSWIPKGAGAWVPTRRRIRVRPELRHNVRLIAHELVHVLQHERLGWRFLPVYLAQWARVGFDYYAIPLEIEARKGEHDPEMLAWARDVIEDQA